ncbi:MAG: AAA family ATPase [Nitrospinia bacterium]
MKDVESLKAQAVGRWLAIISHLAPQLSHACQSPGRHVKCPCHGQKDGFRLFDNASETGGGYCNQTGAYPDGLALLQWTNNWSFIETLEAVADYLGILGGNERTKPVRKIIEQSPYRDEGGQLLYEVVRYEPKDFRQRRLNNKGGWVWDLKGVRHVPYRLPELIASTDMVYIPGGEKDVEALVKLGLTATTNACGEGNWRSEFNEYLKGRDVVILEDNDEKGRKHGRVISESLHGIANEIRIIRFEELSQGGDVTDYLQNNNYDDFVGRVKAAPLFKGSYSEYFPSSSLIEELETWNHIRGLEVKIEWIVDRLIPKESITILFGKGGIGKTWLVMDIARCIGSGIDYLGYKAQQAPVIFIDFENPITVLNTRTQRLGEAKGVHFWRMGNELKPPMLDSSEWEQYKELPKGAVLVFDTLRASQSGDENQSKDMAKVMNRMKELRDLGFTIILLHHTAKNTDNVSKGSTAIVDLADHILGLTRVRQKEGGQDTVADDDVEGFDTESVYYFGNYQKTRFEPHGIHLTLNPDRGFELAPDPEEETLKRIHQLLLNTGPLPKTEFTKECKTLDLGEKKARKLIDKGTGRFWSIEAGGAKNTKLVTAIQFGSSATPIGSAKLPNYPEEELDSNKQESFVI